MKKVSNRKRETKIFENIKIHYDSDYFYITNPNQFLTINDGTLSNGIDIVKNIVILSEEYAENHRNIKENAKVKSKAKSRNQKDKATEKESKEKFRKSIESFRIDHDIGNNYIIHKSEGSTDYFVEASENINMINFMETNLDLLKINNNLEAVRAVDGFKNGKLDLNQIIYIKKSLNLKELIRLYKTAIETKTAYFQYLKLPEHIQNVLNIEEYLIISCDSPEILDPDAEEESEKSSKKRGRKRTTEKTESSAKNKATEKTESNSKSKTTSKNLDDNDDEDNDINHYNDNYNNYLGIQSEELIQIEKELITLMIKSCNSGFKNINLSFGVLDYILAEGITLNSLVDAGMELCVGVEKTEAKTKEIREKLKDRILKSLEDLNVIALIMAALRCEDDFESNRLREVDVSDDPAYLYSDEVLGMAIANQIAGTKAIFNFKRYDEEKPGIISELGPMVDDIFAGLVAGCMSKIFEEDIED